MIQQTAISSNRSEPPPEPTGDSQGFLMLRGLILPLARKEDFILGRDKTLCDIVLAHEHISKQHAIISFRGGRFFVRDMGSLNGTFVNGERVNGIAPLVAGDEIRLPPYMMLFFGPEQPSMAAPTRKASLQKPPALGIQAEPGRKGGSLSGLLSVLSVTDIIQLINFTTQSGVLTIRTPDLQIGEVIFIDGEVVQARFAGKHGAEAVYAVVAAASGEFEFIQGSPSPPAHPIADKTVTLLLEGSRLRDETALEGNLSLA